MKAHTEAEVDRIVGQWHNGIGPDKLHDALGWTRDEYARYENAANGVSEERKEDVLASYAPLAAPDPLDVLATERMAEQQALENPSPEVYEASKSRRQNNAGGMIIGNASGPHHGWERNLFLQLKQTDADRGAPWLHYSRWHCAPVPASEKWIVRSTATGVSRLAEAPNTFDDHAAAQRRADTLNSAEQHALIERMAKENR